MASAEESFSTSIKVTLLHPNDQQPSPRTKNLKTIFYALLILLIILVTGFTILSSICKRRKLQQLDSYESGIRHFYCHLTLYPELCYDSMSSIINTTVIHSNPDLIFSTSLQIAINKLNNVTLSFNKTLSSTTDNSKRLSLCRTRVRDSLSRLSESLNTMDVGSSDFQRLTYEEMDNMKAWALAAPASAVKCFLAMEEIELMVDGEEKMGVQEVKLGLEKARKYMVNSAELLERRESILYEFYNPSVGIDDYYEYSYDSFNYGFMVCLYAALYLFLALVYFLFWRGH